MSVDRHDSLAGKLLQRQAAFCVRLCPFAGTNSPVGAGLPANFGVKECPLAGTIRLQASSYKDKPYPALGDECFKSSSA
jgi:hypothetical protein